MIRATALALALALASPAIAQEPLTAQGLLDTFTSRCKAIAANPEAAIVAAYGSETALGGTTPDRVFLQYREFINLSPEQFVSIYYIRRQLPGGSVGYCGLMASLMGDPVEPVAFPELEGLVDAAAEGILGAKATKQGGDMMQNGKFGRTLLWVTGDKPTDPTLILTQAPESVSLDLQLLTPPN
jgi:hypothetical protein